MFIDSSNDRSGLVYLQGDLKSRQLVHAQPGPDSRPPVTLAIPKAHKNYFHDSFLWRGPVSQVFIPIQWVSLKMLKRKHPIVIHYKNVNKLIKKNLQIPLRETVKLQGWKSLWVVEFNSPFSVEMRTLRPLFDKFKPDLARSSCWAIPRWEQDFSLWSRSVE